MMKQIKIKGDGKIDKKRHSVAAIIPKKIKFSQNLNDSDIYKSKFQNNFNNTFHVKPRQEDRNIQNNNVKQRSLNQFKHDLEQNSYLYSTFEKCLSPRSSSIKLQPVLRSGEFKLEKNGQIAQSYTLGDTQGVQPETTITNGGWEPKTQLIQEHESQTLLYEYRFLDIEKSSIQITSNCMNQNSSNLFNQLRSATQESAVLIEEEMQSVRVLKPKLIQQDQSSNLIAQKQSSLVFQGKKNHSQSGVSIKSSFKQKSPVNQQRTNKLSFHEVSKSTFHQQDQKRRGISQYEEEKGGLNISYINKNTTAMTSNQQTPSRQGGIKYDNSTKLQNSCIKEVSKCLEESPQQMTGSAFKFGQTISPQKNQQQNAMFKTQYLKSDQDQQNNLKMPIIKDTYELHKSSTFDQNDDAISIYPSQRSNFSYEPKYYKPKRQSLSGSYKLNSVNSGNNSPFNQSILNMKLDLMLNNANFVIPGALNQSLNNKYNNTFKYAQSQKVSQIDLGLFQLDNFSSQVNFNETKTKDSSFQQQLQLLKQSKLKNFKDKNQQEEISRQQNQDIGRLTEIQMFQKSQTQKSSPRTTQQQNQKLKTIISKKPHIIVKSQAVSRKNSIVINKNN
eukprot:403349425